MAGLTVKHIYFHWLKWSKQTVKSVGVESKPLPEKFIVLSVLLVKAYDLILPLVLDG